MFIPAYAYSKDIVRYINLTTVGKALRLAILLALFCVASAYCAQQSQVDAPQKSPRLTPRPLVRTHNRQKNLASLAHIIGAGTVEMFEEYMGKSDKEKQEQEKIGINDVPFGVKRVSAGDLLHVHGGVSTRAIEAQLHSDRSNPNSARRQAWANQKKLKKQQPQKGCCFKCKCLCSSEEE